MQKIEKWEDVAPFAGRIIAYATFSSYFGCNGGYCLDNKLKYGRISKEAARWNRDGKGYSLRQMINFGEKVIEEKALTDSKLRGAVMAMRYLSIDEIIDLHQAVSEQNVRLEIYTAEYTLKQITLELVRHGLDADLCKTKIP